MTLTNNWVNSSTNGLITKFLQTSPPPDTRLLLLNAIYFKGKWQTPFDPKQSSQDRFVQWDGSSKNTTFMKMFDVNHLHYGSGTLGNQSMHVLDIPYDKDHVMTLVVPNEVDGLQKSLNVTDLPYQLKELLATQMTRKSSVNLFLPRFKMEAEFNLDRYLQELGIRDVYSPSKADLSGINGQHDLYVSSAKHKAVIEVNEEGTEAAAVTGMTFERMALVLPVEIKCDRPFLFFIRGQNRVVLFSGLFSKVP